MLIRITKSPPAPLMDGFDVRGFRVEGVYEVDVALGRYLIVAEYAEPCDEQALDDSKRRPTRKRPR